VRWTLFVCSDCDTDDGVIVMQTADDRNPESSAVIRHCPGCGSYLSLLNMGEVDVTGTALVHLRIRARA
jgi:hypothetical protein